jgi:Glycosyl transferases group 1
LPEKVSVVPNCLSLPPLPASLTHSLNTTFTNSTTTITTTTTTTGELIKPVKTVAFFGRLETRKGIEIFFDAISMLPAEILSKPDFRVLLIGGSAHIQSQKSEVWIETRIKRLPQALNASQVVLKVGLSRENALKEVLSAETVIAFGSMIENAPFALVEASKLGLPYVALDTGGVQEVVDLESSSASVLFNPLNLVETTTALAAALEVRLRAGRAAVPKLRPAYEQGEKLWVDWHLNTAQEMASSPNLRKSRVSGRETSLSSTNRKLLSGKLPSAALSTTSVKPSSSSEIIYVSVDGPNALIKLHKDACESSSFSQDSSGEILLLVPFKAIEINENFWRQQLLPTLEENLGGKLHAVTLGATVTDEDNNNSTTVAYAGSPTWTYYSNQTLCTPEAPLAIRRKTLCSLRLLSRNFQRADAWTLALLMKKAGLEVAPLPFSEAAVLKEWQMKKCLPENPPAWSFDHDVTANLRFDPQIALFHDLATLGKEPDPLASFFSDSRHWKVLPEAAQSQKCDDSQIVPPYFCGNILHPSSTTTAVASFESWFALDVDFWAEVRTCAFCAEGPITVEVVVVSNNGSEINKENRRVIWKQEFAAGGSCEAQVLSLSGIHVNVGDEIQLVARASTAGHSCSGVYVPTFDIYASGAKKL